MCMEKKKSFCEHNPIASGKKAIQVKQQVELKKSDVAVYTSSTSLHLVNTRIN